MHCALLLLALCSTALAMSTTHSPHATGHHSNFHHNPLYKLIQHEVATLLHQHPDLTLDNCNTKCDALFDLVQHGDERLTDNMCTHACSISITGTAATHKHHTTMQHFETTTNF